MSKLQLIYKSLLQLGLARLLPYAWYQVSLYSGYLHWKTKSDAISEDEQIQGIDLIPLLPIPSKEQLEGILGDAGSTKLLEEAEEIVTGKVRIFGELVVDLNLQTDGDLAHWTAYERGTTKIPLSHLPQPDVKYLWEPARFGWAYTLGRAYLLSGDERFPETFWRQFEVFNGSNPTNRGPHWISGQEVALRLMALVFAAQIFSQSRMTTSERKVAIARSVINHASRIPPTLSYARAQNNNHLLSEAAGLLTAGLSLPSYREASQWKQLGWDWFNRGLRDQISADGTYIQHSTNYHRLMIHLALWVAAICRNRPLGQPIKGKTSSEWEADTLAHQQSKGNSLVDIPPLPGMIYPKQVAKRLMAATGWLRTLLDQDTGRVPNLGPNDGARILPLSAAPFHDYRPVIQAASRVFLGKAVFEPGLWDELGLWLGFNNEGGEEREDGLKEGVGDLVKPGQKEGTNLPVNLSSVRPVRVAAKNSWAYLRSADFTSRPGHADQLHFDLWWRGYNIAKDAGTYLYNAPPPWDNSLARTRVHNTITVDDRDQMTRVGRFLWLDWAQAKLITLEREEKQNRICICGIHDGYKNTGIEHQRIVTAFDDDRWILEDRIHSHDPSIIDKDTIHKVCLHWLLPDWPYEVDETEPGRIQLRLHSPFGWLSLIISIQPDKQPRERKHQVQLIRGGELLYGSDDDFPKSVGWVSPTYAVKVPALSFSTSVKDPLPIRLTSEWQLP